MLGLHRISALNAISHPAAGCMRISADDQALSLSLSLSLAICPFQTSSASCFVKTVDVNCRTASMLVWNVEIAMRLIDHYCCDLASLAYVTIYYSDSLLLSLILPPLPLSLSTLSSTAPLFPLLYPSTLLLSSTPLLSPVLSPLPLYSLLYLSTLSSTPLLSLSHSLSHSLTLSLTHLPHATLYNTPQQQNR